MPHRAKKIVRKVFLALRTDFIPGLPSEHITLAYFDTIEWAKLVKSAVQFDEMLPATIVLKEAMTWESWADDGVYAGYSVTSPDSLILDHLSMPHITVPLPLLENMERTNHDVEIIDRLWLGKKIEGQLRWMRINNEQIGHYYGT